MGCLLVFVGMIAALAFMLSGKVGMIVSALVFWMIVCAVVYIYNRNHKYGIVAGAVSVLACAGMMVYVASHSDWMTACLLMALILAGGVALYGGGMIGWSVFEAGRFIHKRFRLIQRRP